MRLRWLSIAAALIVLALGVGRVLDTPTPVQAEEPDVREGGNAWIKAGAGPVFVPGEIVVRLRGGLPAQAIDAFNRNLGATTVRVGARSGLIRVKLPAGADVETSLAAYRSRPEVAEAAPNVIARAFGGPNDPLYGLQWHLDYQGNTSPTWNGINWQDVWERPDPPKGTGVTVAIIDTGVAWDNPNATDLQGQSFLILPGADVFNNNDPNPTDDHGHGTHVAGTIAQRTHSTPANGVAGVASGATIVPIKVLNNTGEGTEVEVIEGIYLAINATAPCNPQGPPHARVINMSLGWPVGTTLDQLPGLADALDCANSQDVVVVAAAGNDGSPNDIAYPAKYPSVIAVGATTIDEEYTWYSNASTEIDLVAPGGDDCSGDNWILCLFLGIDPDKNGDGYTDGVVQQTFALGSNPDVASNWAYYFLAGTSMASPHVAGVAALVRGLNPSLSADATRDILQNTADRLNLGWPSGNGLVNAAAAVQAAQPAAGNTSPTALNNAVSTNEDTAAIVTLTATDTEQCELSFSVLTNPTKGNLSALSGAACTPGSPNTDRASLTYNPNLNTNGSDSFTYRAYDGSANSNTATVTITVNLVNDAPVANNDTAITSQNTPVTISALANDTDVDGNPLTVSSLTPPANGMATNNGNTISYTPSSAFTGTDTFTYTASDGTASSNVATVTVTVTVTATTLTCTAPIIVSSSDSNASRGGTVSFAWNPIDGASEYTVQRQKGKGWTTQQVSSATSFTGADALSDPQWRVFISAGTCTPVPGPAFTFDP